MRPLRKEERPPNLTESVTVLPSEFFVRGQDFRDGNHRNGYTSGSEYCSFWVEALPPLPSRVIFPPPPLPERVMVRAVGHWSNTNSLGVRRCSNGATEHSYRGP